MAHYDPIEAGRMEIALDTSGEWIVSFDGKEQLRSIHTAAVQRECARLFLRNSVRHSDKDDRPLKQYRVQYLPRSLEDRLTQVLDEYMAELRRAAQHREVTERIMRQPSGLRRHWNALH